MTEEKKQKDGTKEMLENMDIGELRERVVSLTMELEKKDMELKQRTLRNYIISILGEHGADGYRTEKNSIDDLGGEIARVTLGPEIARIMRSAIVAEKGYVLNLSIGLTQFFFRGSIGENVANPEKEVVQ